jgi:hypothetical protein
MTQTRAGEGGVARGTAGACLLRLGQIAHGGDFGD